MNESPVRIAPVRRAGAAGGDADPDLLAAEEPLSLELEYGPAGSRRLLNIGIVLRTPGPASDDRHLAAGLLFAERFVRSSRDIDRFDHRAAGHLRIHLAAGIEVEERRARRVLVRTSACGVCGRDAIDDLAAAGSRAMADSFRITEAILMELPSLLRREQKVFNDTGGLHAAALCSPAGTLESIAEDIGRHNAVDKLIGRALLGDALPLGERVLLVSGRAAFEIVHKAVMAGAPVLAAVGAPSSLAVETARAFNLTLVGFLRGDRFNIYSGFDRIV